MTLLALATCVASAQQRNARPQPPPPRFNAPPPQQQQQRPDRGERNSGQQNPNGEQRQGDRRFVFQGPGPHAGQWLREHGDDPPEKQMKELQSDPNFRRLSPERQQQFINRLNRLNSMPAQRREQTLNELDVIEHMTPQQRERARGLFSDLRRMPDERQRAVGSALRDLRIMSPEDRQRTIDSEDYRRNYSDQERNLMRGMTELGLYPGGPRD